MNAHALLLFAALTGADLPFEAPSTSAPAVTDAAHTRVRLVVRGDSSVPGRPLEVAVVLESEPGWHTYWKNPGDAGMATSVTWTLPKGWKAGELAWPAPSRFQEKEVATFGYSGAVWLLTSLEGPSRPGTDVTLSARVDWLECRDICLPGSANVKLTVPAKTAKAADEAAFAAARAKIPEEASGWKVGAKWSAERKLVLDLLPAPGTRLGDDTFFFPYEPGILEPSADAKLTDRAKGGYSLELTPARMAVGVPPTLDGVLVSGGRAWHVRVPLPPREI